MKARQRLFDSTFVVAFVVAIGLSAMAHEPTVLFDGTSMDAWRSYSSDELPAGWEISDSTLHRSGGGGDIMTKEKFGNFELKLEWKISPGGNSGIIYRVREGDGATYFSGPEYQVLDDSAHKGEDRRHLSAALYGLYECESDAAKPAGEWNTAKIVVQDNQVEHWLNGKKVVDCKLGSDDWNQRVANSKFNAWEQFAKSEQGHIALQDHGNPVWYRNITITNLDEHDH